MSSALRGPAVMDTRPCGKRRNGVSRIKRIKTMGGSRLGLAIVAAVATAVVIGGVVPRRSLTPVV